MQYPDTAKPTIRLVEREVYRNRFVTLFDDDVAFSDGSAGRYIRLVAGDGSPASAVLVTSGRYVALVLTYRYPIGKWEWAIPRGMASSIDPHVSALRELQEELGGKPTSIEELGVIHPDSGVLAAEVRMFHARWEHPVAVPEDTREVQGVMWVTWEELADLLRRGEITDGFTLAAFALGSLQGLDE